MFRLIDRFAGWWLNLRMTQYIAGKPELQDFNLKEARFDVDDFHMIASFPGVVILAEQCSQMLEANNAKNYVEFDMMPRLDRGIRPIRVTVQWINGLSPAKKATRLVELVKEAYYLLLEWPPGYSGIDKSQDVVRRIVEFLEEDQ